MNNTNRPLMPILFALAAAIYFGFTIMHGWISGKIQVLLFRMAYGPASYAEHPLWYIFGMGEWCFLLALSVLGVWRLLRK
ncbi:MAG: hypothetical protein M0003_18625 [Acidithiobacillus sp.]|nr:hypothetical protein [Acidithiobacillus sp.]